MNTFSKNTKALFALLLSCCLLVVGCKDDEQPVAEPDAEITSITPTSGPVGTPVTIVGTNFGGTDDVQKVDFNGTEAVITSASNTNIVVSVPEGATTGNVNIRVRDKNITGPAFTVEDGSGEPNPDEMTITAIDPTSGPVGTTVIITGTNFGAELSDQMVMFNGVEAEITALTNEEITVLVPTGATTGVVSFTSGETTVEGPSFEVTVEEEEPGITSVAPTAGPVGTEVSIRGYGFGEDMDALAVDFNGTAAEITSATNEEVMVVVPAGAMTGPVNLIVDGTTYTSPEDFTVTEETEGGIYFGDGFNLSAPIETNGQSGLKEGLGINGETILRLTPAKADRTGSAYYGTTVAVEGGFETVFDFRISRPGKPADIEGERGADGFAFIIQNEGANAYGGRGPDKGYGGIMNAVVVDFDIYKNEEDGDPNGNHVSVQVSKGGGPVHADENYRLALASSDTFPDMPVDFITNEQGFHTARVVYTPGTDGAKGQLMVWIDDMAEPMVAELNLQDYLNSNDGTAYVGFTASTNPNYGWASFDILNWMFQPTTNGEGAGE